MEETWHHKNIDELDSCEVVAGKRRVIEPQCVIQHENIQNPWLLLHSVGNPSVHICLVRGAFESIQSAAPEPERAYRGGRVAELQHPLHEHLECRLPLLIMLFPLGVAPLELADVGLDAGHGAPEVEPPPRQHARPHSLARGQERQDDEDDVVGDGAKQGIILRAYNFNTRKVLTRGGVTEFHHPLHEHIERQFRLMIMVPFPLGVSCELVYVGVDAGHGAPELTPPSRKHARLHSLARGQEGHDVEDDVVRDVAEPVPVVSVRWGRDPPPLARRPLHGGRACAQRRFVEQLARVETGRERKTKNQQPINPQLNSKQDSRS
uniref:Uncharacterized protein n=1 Tax=Oryza punctata TaxID=4537 RepID=A0A0E0M571_ORYPU